MGARHPSIAAISPGTHPTVADLLSAYAGGDLRPSDVVAATFDAIEACAPLGAFWASDRQRAIEEAQQADQDWRHDHRAGRPLLGVPVAVKDIFDTAGMRTTYGSSFYRQHVPGVDADAVAGLRRAGAIVVGKTATHEFAFGVTSVNPHYGPARNPHDPTRSTGGSSGGSAAAVAAGVVPIALGSDTSCSVRQPPAWTGCVGFRPTHDTISLGGAAALAPSFDAAGAIGSSVADASALAEVLWGASPGTVAAPPDLDLPAVVRVGVIDGGWPASPAPEVEAALLAAAEALSTLGCRLEPVVIDGYTSANEIFGGIFMPEAADTHRRLGFWPGRADGYGPDVAERLRLADAVALDTHLEARQRQRDLRVRMRRAYEAIDVLLTPAAAITAPPIDGCDKPVHQGVATPIRDLVLPFNVVAPLCGGPAIVVPVGRDAGGLPTSVMLSAAPAHDRLLLDLAARLESVLAYDRTPPRLPQEFTP